MFDKYQSQTEKDLANISVQTMKRGRFLGVQHMTTSGKSVFIHLGGKLK